MQFHQGFGFAKALDLVPYLSRLGISHLYASPLFAAQRGSIHGYDVVDPTRLNPELGTENEFGALVDALREHEMGLILDIVPNHMAASTENPWWVNVLQNGSASAFAPFFDIDWSVEAGKVVLPFLGRPIESAIDAGDVVYADGRVFASGAELPVAPGTNGGTITDVLEQQHYRLACWRDETPNYRRFFEINDLVGIRVEDAAVFEATHALIFDLLSAGKVQGLRVDHVDGLLDPSGYLRRLRTRANEAAGFEPYIVVEKILSSSESVPAHWSVDGTTGYDWLGMANGVLTDGGGMRRLSSVYRTFTGSITPVDAIVRERKRAILASRFPREVRRLASQSVLSSGGDARMDLAEDAIIQLSSALPVYRTYGGERRDASRVDRAAKQAIEAGADPAAVEQFRVQIVGTASVTGSSDLAPRWQQLTGPAMAKGMEDSAFYRYNRLISLNEVGGDCEATGTAAFHRFIQRRARRWPDSMNATSTHDTKRSEDLRARLAMLSEIPREWEQRVHEWSRAARIGGAPPIDLNTEYHLWQSAVGAWPTDGIGIAEFSERLDAYMKKAIREAGEFTSWIAVDDVYETAVAEFVSWLSTDVRAIAVRASVETFVRGLEEAAQAKSLSLLVMKLTTPGIPDVYQGQELWDFSFADPDNRRTVDFSERMSALDSFASPDGPPLHELMKNPADGRCKAFVTWRLLLLRQEYPGLFAKGDYLPLKVRGDHAGRLISFARRDERRWILVVVPRLNGPGKGTSNLGDDLESGTILGLPSDAPTTWFDWLNAASEPIPDMALRVENIHAQGLLVATGSSPAADDSGTAHR